MSDDEEDLYDVSLPGGDPGREGWMLKFVIAGVVVMLLYGVVTLLLAAGVV